MGRSRIPPWVPDVDPPNALTAPRGVWLQQLEAMADGGRGEMNSGLDVVGDVNTGGRAFSDAAAYRSDGAAAVSAFTAASPFDGFEGIGAAAADDFVAAQLLGGDGLDGVASDSSCDSAVSTPRVSVIEAEDDGMRLDQILQGLELNVAPTMHVSPVNFVDDAVLDLPTRKFAQFLKTVDPSTATAIKAARRRKKNREYAQLSRERRRERGGGSISPREGTPSPRSSTMAIE